jgi:hypothetical protein
MAAVLAGDPLVVVVGGAVVVRLRSRVVGRALQGRSLSRYHRNPAGELRGGNVSDFWKRYAP